MEFEPTTTCLGIECNDANQRKLPSNLRLDSTELVNLRKSMDS